MNKLALLTLALVAAGVAGAANAGSSGEDEYNEQNRASFTSTMTRADVQAQLADAIRRHEIDPGGEATPSYAVNQQAGSQRDRGAVREEAVLAAHSQKLQELM